MKKSRVVHVQLSIEANASIRLKVKQTESTAQSCQTCQRKSSINSEIRRKTMLSSTIVAITNQSLFLVKPGRQTVVEEEMKNIRSSHRIGMKRTRKFFFLLPHACDVNRRSSSRHCIYSKNRSYVKDVRISVSIRCSW